jgi:eukaryotic-like serine/threonine-protein kinase
MTAGLLKEGQVFAQRYRIVRCLASGGMGTVYEARHAETERRVALKVMLPHIVLSEDMRARFKLEARVTANIGSEFIVDVLDAGVDDETELPFLVMEFLVGQDLGELLEQSGPIAPTDALTYLQQVALALAKTHAQLIVHRDLKPENLFLTFRDDGSPRIKIFDFGISKVVVESATHRNETLNLGTPSYMAPEQFAGSVSPATDIYALGMIAYALMVGVPYWHHESQIGQNVFVFARKVMNGPTEQPTLRAERHGVALPPGFDAWFKKCAAADPKDRFGSALEAVGSLSEVFAISLPKPGPGCASLRPPPLAASGSRKTASEPKARAAATADVGPIHTPVSNEQLSTEDQGESRARVGVARGSSMKALVIAASVLVVGGAGAAIVLGSGVLTTSADPEKVQEAVPAVRSASASAAALASVPPLRSSAAVVVLDDDPSQPSQVPAPPRPPPRATAAGTKNKIEPAAPKPTHSSVYSRY